jgi:hypothetical protein
MNLGLIDLLVLIIVSDLNASLILSVEYQVVLDHFFFEINLVCKMLFTDVHRVKSHIIVVMF